MAVQKSNLACQVVNSYKGRDGQFVFYAECRPRALEETDPALSYGKTSIVSLNILDTKESKSAVAYLNAEDPAYLQALAGVFQAFSIGRSACLILVVPFVLLFSYLKTHKNPGLDKLVPLGGILFVIFALFETAYLSFLFIM